MRAQYLPMLDETFSLSSDSSESTPIARNAPKDGIPKPLRFARPSQITLPEPEENNECYGQVLQYVSDSQRADIVRNLVRPTAIIFREGVDPGETTEAFAALENKYFHPDSGDDSQFQMVIDHSRTVCPIVTVYIIPEDYLPQVVYELAKKKLSLIRGAPIIKRGQRIDTYDPSRRIARELGLAIEKRLFMVDRPFTVEDSSAPRFRMRRPSSHRGVRAVRKKSE
jgi:hypothetical protein